MCERDLFISEIKIPYKINGHNIEGIDDYAFHCIYKLQYIEIEEGIKYINHFAFSQCVDIGNIIIPSSVENIDQLAFKGCTNLTSITINDENKYYLGENGILYNKDKSELIAFPSAAGDISLKKGIKSIGNVAFYNCYNLTSVVIPEGVTSICDSAFEDCYSLTSVVIPEGVTSICYRAFEGCYNLTTVIIPNSVTDIGKNAFKFCSSLASVEFKNQTGWKVGNTSIDVSDATINADNLTNVYDIKQWTRTD